MCHATGLIQEYSKQNPICMVGAANSVGLLLGLSVVEYKPLPRVALSCCCSSLSAFLVPELGPMGRSVDTVTVK